MARKPKVRKIRKKNIRATMAYLRYLDAIGRRHLPPAKPERDEPEEN